MNVKEGGWRAKDSLSAKEKKKKKKSCHWHLNEDVSFCCCNWVQNPASFSAGQNVFHCKRMCQFWAHPVSLERASTVISVLRTENKNNLRFLKHQCSYTVPLHESLPSSWGQTFSLTKKWEPAICFLIFCSSFLLLIYVTYSRKSKMR